MGRLWFLLVLISIIQFTATFPYEKEEQRDEIATINWDAEVAEANNEWAMERSLFSKSTPEEKLKKKLEKEKKELEKLKKKKEKELKEMEKKAKEEADKLAKKAEKEQKERDKKKQKEEEKLMKKQKEKEKELQKENKKKEDKKLKEEEKLKKKKEKEEKKKRKEEEKLQKKKEKEEKKRRKEEEREEKKRKEEEESAEEKKAKQLKKEEKRKEKEQKLLKKKAEKERKKLEKEKAKEEDPDFDEKQKDEDKKKFNFLNKTPSEKKKKVGFLAGLKDSPTLAKIKSKLEKLKDKAADTLADTEFKYTCKCEDNSCECCVKFMVKVCFAMNYQRIGEESMVALKLSARLGIDIPLYTHMLHFKKKFPACFNIGSPIGRTCFKGESEVKKGEDGKKIALDIKVLFDDLLVGVQINLEWEDGSLTNKGLETFSHIPKNRQDEVDESKESNESSGNKEKTTPKPNKVNNKIRVSVPEKFKMKVNSGAAPKGWEVKDLIAVNLRKATDGDCECVEEKCECCVNFGIFRACMTTVYIPPSDGIDSEDNDRNDDYLDLSSEESGESKESSSSEESKKGSGESDNGTGESDNGTGESDNGSGDVEVRSTLSSNDAVDTDGELEKKPTFGAMLTIVGSLKRVKKDGELVELHTVSSSALEDSDTELECEPSKRFGNICLKMDSVYLAKTDEARGTCVSFVMAEYGFGFKKCIAIQDDDTLSIGDPDTQ